MADDPEAKKTKVVERRNDREAEELFAAAAAGDVARVAAVLAAGTAASAQDKGTGRSALMCAAAAGSVDCVGALLQAGAPWNALDRAGKCAGEYACEAQSQGCVDLLVNAGVAAQLLFGVLDDETTTDDRTTEAYLEHGVHFSEDGQTLNDAQGDAVMMEWERPLMEAHADVLCGRFDHAWSRDLGPLVVSSSSSSSSKDSFAVCNVGHGMAIIDEAIQRKLQATEATHHIMEPHPGVLAKMRRDGWFDRPNVRVHASTWQRALEDLSADEAPFDAVFFDTYAEKYGDMVAFFRALPRLLKKPRGVFSFFNGMCPFNPFFHGVACELVKVELDRLGLDLDFVPLQVDALGDETWRGVKRRYWLFDTYHLPIARWKHQPGPSDEESSSPPGSSDQPTAEA